MRCWGVRWEGGRTGREGCDYVCKAECQYRIYGWFTNFDASCLCVKEREDLIDASSILRSFFRNEFSKSGLVTEY
jgi:hypothetical protein